MCDDAGQLMSVDEVVSCMRAEKFKPNCALGTSCSLPQSSGHSPTCSQVLLGFLVRHGYLTSENEPRFLEINQRLHGGFDIERW